MKKQEYSEFILRNYEQSRSSDELLIYYHLRCIGIHLTAEQLRLFKEGCKNTVSLYNLVRYRQKFQEKGKYLGTPEVMLQRHKKGVKRTQEEREEKTPPQAPREVIGWVTDNITNKAYPVYSSLT